MRRLLILVAIFTLAVLDAGLVSSRTAAQADPMASPAAVDGGSQFRGIPPEECQVPPRPSDEVFAFLGMAEGSTDATPAVRTPVPAPRGSQLTRRRRRRRRPPFVSGWRASMPTTTSGSPRS